jgi:hypothetical protein
VAQLAPTFPDRPLGLNGELNPWQPGDPAVMQEALVLDQQLGDLPVGEMRAIPLDHPLVANPGNLVAMSELHGREHSLTRVTFDNNLIVVRGGPDSVNAASSNMPGETIDILHTQPGIHNVVPSEEDLQVAADAGSTLTIQARGNGPNDIVSLTLGHDEINRLLHLHHEPTHGPFVQEMIRILRERKIDPPEDLRVASDLSEM